MTHAITHAHNDLPNTPNPRRNVARATVCAFAVPVVAASALLAPAALTASPANAISHFSGGGTTIAGRSWLGGQGVPVIRSRQCTELATRMYQQKRWGNLMDIYNTHKGRPYDGGRLQFHRNGSGYIPVPGDVLVEHGGSYQHVAVVDYVKGRAIYTVEQNATPSARHIYGWDGRSATGAYGPRHVGGFIHSLRADRDLRAQTAPKPTTVG